MYATAGNNLCNIAESPDVSSQIEKIFAGEEILISLIAAVATAAGVLVTPITFVYKKSKTSVMSYIKEGKTNLTV